ncbi:hypothetical protein NM688_g8455 [Phlebia brevispora]|uniref:Uncharacterized protein n=1 Tax=Phlebia brevispora TaxID=194682 RepID=A0ACC1RSG0_9APHY|nr:hypothetical protein NM688_g8455 [Phlebia brevispora]
MQLSILVAEQMVANGAWKDRDRWLHRLRHSLRQVVTSAIPCKRRLRHWIRYISGEVTIALLQWWKTGKAVHERTVNPAPETSNLASTADPYTAEAFHSRTQLANCSTLSFKDVADGKLPEACLESQNPQIPLSLLHTAPFGEDDVVEMTVCSFALHLIESPSELFGLLWQLSTKCRWLVILAPHKKPEIKEGWGWTKWNIDEWNECRMSDSKGELLQDRVHCRVYRSLNLS